MRTIFTGHSGGVRGLAFIGSGTILFSASKDKMVMEWDLIQNVHRKTLSGSYAAAGSGQCEPDLISCDAPCLQVTLARCGVWA